MSWDSTLANGPTPGSWASEELIGTAQNPSPTLYWPQLELSCKQKAFSFQLLRLMIQFQCSSSFQKAELSWKLDTSTEGMYWTAVDHNLLCLYYSCSLNYRSMYLSSNHLDSWAFVGYLLNILHPSEPQVYKRPTKRFSSANALKYYSTRTPSGGIFMLDQLERRIVTEITDHYRWLLKLL